MSVMVYKAVGCGGVHGSQLTVMGERVGREGENIIASH